MFFKAYNTPAKELCSELKKRGILVRHYDDERICDYIRMTIGTHAEMRRVIQALMQIEKNYVEDWVTA